MSLEPDQKPALCVLGTRNKREHNQMKCYDLDAIEVMVALNSTQRLGRFGSVIFLFYAYYINVRSDRAKQNIEGKTNTTVSCGAGGIFFDLDTFLLYGYELLMKCKMIRLFARQA